MQLHSTQESMSASTVSAASDAVTEAEEAPPAVRLSAFDEWRRGRALSLQDALVSARTYETMGANGCFLSGVLWIAGWFGRVLLSGMSSNLLSLVPAFCLVVAPLLLMGSGGLYLVGMMRRRGVLASAQEHRVELRDFGAASTWIVRGSSLDDHRAAQMAVELTEGQVGFPAGARLEAGLAADRHYRGALADRFQQKLRWAASAEKLGRRGCLAAGMVALGLLACAAMMGLGHPAGDPRGYLLSAAAAAVAVGLPVCTLLAGAGSGWRRWLLRAARLQALEVERVNDSRSMTP